MSLTNPNKVVTEERLSEFYGEILPYLGGMPELLGNKIARGDLYSTSEKIIGQWVDSKPIYQKTIDFGALPNESTKTVNHSISNIDKIVSYEMIGNDATGYAYETNYTGEINIVNNKLPSALVIWVDKTAVTITTGRDRSGLTAYVTIRYTKTTDSAQAVGVDTDYSTTEKIVGTWIDGKPLYQKTVNCGALPNATMKDINIATANAISVKNLYGYALRNSDGMVVALPRPNPTLASNIAVDIISNQTQIRITTIGDYSSFTESYITLQYTKN